MTSWSWTWSPTNWLAQVSRPPAARRTATSSRLDTGPEAKVYADHHILAHMNTSSDGRTYGEVRAEYIALSDEETASEEGQR